LNCDRIARWYRWLEYLSFGRALERRRFEYLTVTADARRVLMLGEGDGRFLAAFVRDNDQAEVDSIESSREMMRLAADRIRGRGRVTFHHADARLVGLPAGEYDLVVTHFFLDCFSTEESAGLISRISGAAAPRARWLISEFDQHGEGFARYWTALLIRCCYFFFRLTTGLETTRLPEYRGALRANGFARMRYKEALGGLLISELWERVS
jgi:ubiquinone/menaquinone biosynthesis C-methylase UbiE